MTVWNFIIIKNGLADSVNKFNNTGLVLHKLVKRKN